MSKQSQNRLGSTGSQSTNDSQSTVGRTKVASSVMNMIVNYAAEQTNRSNSIGRGDTATELTEKNRENDPEEVARQQDFLEIAASYQNMVRKPPTFWEKRSEEFHEEWNECKTCFAGNFKIQSWPSAVLLTIFFIFAVLTFVTLPLNLNVFTTFGPASFSQSAGYFLSFLVSVFGSFVAIPMIFSLQQRIMGTKMLLLNETLLIGSLVASLTACIFLDAEPNKSGLLTMFKFYHKDGQAQPKFLELLETELKCCGINGKEDYDRFPQKHTKYPLSCCINVTACELTNGTLGESLIHHRGCLNDSFYSQTRNETYDGKFKNYNKVITVQMIVLFFISIETVLFNFYYFLWPHIPGECPSIEFNERHMYDYGHRTDRT